MNATPSSISVKRRQRAHDVISFSHVATYDRMGCTVTPYESTVFKREADGSVVAIVGANILEQKKYRFSPEEVGKLLRWLRQLGIDIRRNT